VATTIANGNIGLVALLRANLAATSALLASLLGSGGGVAGITVDAPVLSNLTGYVAGHNVPQWQSAYSNVIVYDPVTSSGDKVIAHWRSNGGAWTTEAEKSLTSDVLLSAGLAGPATGGFLWPLLQAAYPLPHTLFEAEEQIVRYSAGVETGRSVWSNTWSDTPDAVTGNYLRNGAFNDASVWTLGTGSTISGGKLNSVNGALMCYQPIDYVNGGVYHVEFDYTCTSGVKLRVGLANTSGGDTVVVSAPILTDGSLQHLALDFTANVGAGYLLIEADSATFTGTIDNITLWRVS
jgi:hypothetical protein